MNPAGSNDPAAWISHASYVFSCAGHAQRVLLLMVLHSWMHTCFNVGYTTVEFSADPLLNRSIESGDFSITPVPFLIVVIIIVAPH